MIKTTLHQGAHLSFKVGGRGKQTLILIHNAGGNHQFMDSQFHHFSKQGRGVSIDLRGHGESDKPEQEYTVEGFAEDLVNHCSHLISRKALSSGPWITLEAPEQVNTMIDQFLLSERHSL